MSAQERLTKAEILKGMNYVHEVAVEELGGLVALRPLRESEWAEIESTKVKGLEAKSKGDPSKNKEQMEMGFDLSKVTNSDYLGDRMAVAYGLSCEGEKWTHQDVGKLPAGVVKKLASKVYEISGVTSQKEELIQNFRNEP